MQFKIKDIANLIGGEIVGDPETAVSSVGKIEDAKLGDISFLANPKYENYIYDTNASAVIVSKEFAPKKEIKTNLIKVADPYSSFTALLEEYNRLQVLTHVGIEDPSFISDTSTYGENIYVGAFAYIGKNVSIGKNVKIFPQAYIGNNVKIGDNTIIHPGVKIHDNSVIGNHCTLQANAVIGSDGFGFAPQADGTYKAIPQLGNVIIEDHVNIGANTVVDCATMGSTIIKSGVKLDNLIQVAHNAEIGENTVIASQTGISGSTKIGKSCVIGGQVGFSGHISIPDQTKIGAQAGIMSAPKKPGTSIIGSPAFDVKGFMKSYVVFRNLPDFTKRIEDLEEKILNLVAENRI